MFHTQNFSIHNVVYGIIVNPNVEGKVESLYLLLTGLIKQVLILK